MSFEYLETYVTFRSVEDMDEAVKKHISTYRLDLTASERAIVFALAGRSLAFPGASHLKAETIANAIGVSTKTVYRSIKKLAEFGIIEKVPQPKLNGIKGASIYKILPFENNVLSDVSQRATGVEVNNGNALSFEQKELSIKSFNLLSSKQANNIYLLGDTMASQAEKKKEYMNEWQVMLFDFLHSMPFVDQLKDELHKLVLASQVDSVQAFHRAKDVIVKMACDIASGTLTVTSTLRAVFVGAFKARNKRMTFSPIESVQESKRPVPFYDWLTERENCPQVINDHRPIENWLEW